MRTDRKDFLGRLGALEPNQRVQLPIVTDVGKKTGKAREPLVFGADLPTEELAKPPGRRKRVRPSCTGPCG